MFNLLTPERGLLHVLFGTFFFVQLLSTIAGTSGRALLRSLTVLFGSAFVLRYIVLESLYAPTGGTLARVLTVLLEGVSLGAMQYEPAAPATGYLAFLALGCIWWGCPSCARRNRERSCAASRSRRRTAIVRALVLCALAGTLACGRASVDSGPASGTPVAGLVSSVVRDRSLAAARVWSAGRSIPVKRPGRAQPA